MLIYFEVFNSILKKHTNKHTPTHLYSYHFTLIFLICISFIMVMKARPASFYMRGSDEKKENSKPKFAYQNTKRTTTTTTKQTNKPTTTTKMKVPNGDSDDDGPEGCYLIFEPHSGGRLIVQYSRNKIPLNAIGFWCAGPGRKIQAFKYNNAGGRSELIKGIAGGDSNRRKYYTGWCLFIKLAKAMNGYVIKFPTSAEKQGVEVDIVAYKQSSSQPYELDLDSGLIEIGDFDAVSVIPKHNTTFRGVKRMPESNFLELGNLAGASTKLM